MANLVETYPCVPSTERGRGILISGHPKKDAFVYTNGRAVIIRSLDRPTEAIVYGEHGYPATVARFSPNGEWVASADVSGTVRIWGVNNDHVLRNEFRVLSGRIDDLQWSPDCERIVASGEGKGKSFIRAFMWDSGTAVGEFDGHSRRVLSCDFKPTRPFRIATCGEDFLVNFYDGPPFKFKLSQRGHSNFVNCVRFSPDGSKFISVSSDKKGILYDGKTGDKIGELSSEDGHNGSIYAVSWSPDSKALLTVSADKTAKIWVIDDQGNGNVKKTLNSTTSSLEGMLVGCLWHRDYLVVVSLGGIISIYSASDLEKPPVSFSGHKKSVNSLAAFQEGPQRIILSSSYDGLIVRWIRGIGYAGRLERADNSQIKSFAVVEGELITTGFDNKVRRIPLEGENCGGAEILDVGAEPKDLSIAQNASELVLLSHDTGIIMLHGSKVVASIKLGFNVTASCISPDGTEAVVGGEDGKLRVYSINGATLTEEAVLEKHRGAVNIIRFSPDGSMFASGDLNREAVVWDRTSREVKVKNMLYHTSRINCIAWSPNSMLVATASIDTSVIVYEVDKPATARRTIKGAHLGGVFGLVFNDDMTLASSGEDAMIRVWELVPQ